MDNLAAEKSQSNKSQPTKVVAWPDLSIDRRAANQAFEELGDTVSLSKLLERAQQIKDEILARKARDRKVGQ